MTTYIKIMSYQNLPDSDSAKNFTMLTLADGDSFRFVKIPLHRNGSNATEDVLQIRRVGEADYGPSITLEGNVYIMDRTGKTFATHNASFSHVPNA